jgi:hypothetical protein
MPIRLRPDSVDHIPSRDDSTKNLPQLIVQLAFRMGRGNLSAQFGFWGKAFQRSGNISQLLYHI